MTSPNSPQSHEPAQHQVGYGFRIGNPRSTQEFTVNGRRFLSWQPNGLESEIGSEAGWMALRHEITIDTAYLEIPEGTRSAASVLGGMEAWQGEKSEVLNAIGNYVGRIYRKFGCVDGNASLDTVGVTKDERLVFATPPHIRLESKDDIEQWLNRTKEDIRLTMTSEPEDKIDDVIGGFLYNIQKEAGSWNA